MNNNINLLDYKSKIEIVKKHEVQNRLRIVAIILLFLVSVSSVALFMLISLSPLPELSRQKKLALYNLQFEISDIVRLGLITDRADSIDTILKNRLKYDEYLDNIQGKLPPDINIESFQLKDRKLVLILNSKSLLSLDNFSTIFINVKDPTNKASNIVMTGLSKDPRSDRFLMTVHVTYNE